MYPMLFVLIGKIAGYEKRRDKMKKAELVKAELVEDNNKND